MGKKELKKFITAQELQSLELPEIHWVLEDIIPPGLTLLAGKPKLGKSYFVLNFAIELAQEGVRVLYLALEDSQGRLSNRMEEIMGNSDWPKCLTFVFSGEWHRLNKGGLEDFEDWLDDHPDTKLIIIDTLERVRPQKKAPGYNYSEDYDALTPLHTLSNKRNVAILIVHHTKKGKADDDFDKISGTTGLTGVPDTIAILSEMGPGRRVYKYRGRDVEEGEIIFRFEKGKYIRDHNGEIDTAQLSEQRKEIIRYVESIHGIVERKDMETLKTLVGNSFDVLLRKLVESGKIKKVEYGKYESVTHFNDRKAMERLRAAKLSRVQ